MPQNKYDNAADLHIYGAHAYTPPLPHINAAITKPQKSLVQRRRTTRWQLLRKHSSSRSKFTFL
jgi:hypothetical protein